MLLFLLALNFIFHFVVGSEDYNDIKKIDSDLALSLRTDANLDLSKDEEYEDLRAEFLAYHTALASLVDDKPSRRSMVSTPCWRLNGICINHNLCSGYKYLTQVPGCKDKLKVCCFVWNEYNVRELKEEGIRNLGFPWSLKQEIGGKGVVPKLPKKPKKTKKNKEKNTIRSGGDNIKSIALVLFE